jgi:transcription-repair coupling factor (superfamily II helicase)
MQFDNIVVKEAILREYNRGGKSFFVVPRIRDLEEMAPKLKELFPDLKIEVANGQMPANQIEKIIADFIDGKIDVLLSTTIIESGLDIANANSIIVYKAEAFGMAQLYQLRGRVGRAKIRGYAYFMTSKAKIADDAKKKLEIMQNLDALGVGFTIASCDMDIRGSGDLLGDEQSGHIKETGVELYQQMLIEEIARVKNIDENHQNIAIANKNTDEDDFIPQIKLAISLLIPSDYIEDLQLRMSFYKKISLIKNNQDKENIEIEMIDRFGKIPETVSSLIEIALLKNKCRDLGVGKIEAINEGLVVSFYNDKLFNSDILRDNLFKMIFSSNSKIRFYQPKNQANNQAFKGSVDNATAKINHQKILFTQKFIDDKSKIEASQQAMQKLSALLS